MMWYVAAFQTTKQHVYMPYFRRRHSLLHTALFLLLLLLLHRFFGDINQAVSVSTTVHFFLAIEFNESKHTSAFEFVSALAQAKTDKIKGTLDGSVNKHFYVRLSDGVSDHGTCRNRTKRRNRSYHGHHENN